MQCSLNRILDSRSSGLLFLSIESVLYWSVDAEWSAWFLEAAQQTTSFSFGAREASISPSLLRPRRGSEHCDGHVAFVCPRAYLRNYTSDLRQIFARVNDGRYIARPSSGGAAIRYALPVLCMTSCLHIMVVNRRGVLKVKKINRWQHAFDSMAYTQPDPPGVAPSSRGEIWYLRVPFCWCMQSFWYKDLPI